MLHNCVFDIGNIQFFPVKTFLYIVDLTKHVELRWVCLLLVILGLFAVDTLIIGSVLVLHRISSFVLLFVVNLSVRLITKQ